MQARNVELDRSRRPARISQHSPRVTRTHPRSCRGRTGSSSSGRGSPLPSIRSGSCHASVAVSGVRGYRVASGGRGSPTCRPAARVPSTTSPAVCAPPAGASRSPAYPAGRRRQPHRPEVLAGLLVVGADSARAGHHQQRSIRRRVAGRLAARDVHRRLVAAPAVMHDQQGRRHQRPGADPAGGQRRKYTAAGVPSRGPRPGQPSDQPSLSATVGTVPVRVATRVRVVASAPLGGADADPAGGPVGTGVDLSSTILTSW